MLSKGRRGSDKVAFAPKRSTHIYFFSIFNCSFEIDHHNDREFLGPIREPIKNVLAEFVR